MEDLPAFFGKGPGILPEGVTSLLGELEEAGLGGDDGPDELDEMNTETFGAASMDALGGFFGGATTAVRCMSPISLSLGSSSVCGARPPRVLAADRLTPSHRLPP